MAKKQRGKAWHTLTMSECRDTQNGSVWIKFQADNIEEKGYDDVPSFVEYLESQGFDIVIRTSMTDEQKVKNAAVRLVAKAKELGISEEELFQE